MKRGATELMVALGLAGLVLGLSMPDEPAHAQQVVADPPVLLRLEGPARVRVPGGDVVLLPAGSEIGACGDLPLRFDLDSRVARVPEPCTETRVFANGFEAL